MSETMSHENLTLSYDEIVRRYMEVRAVGPKVTHGMASHVPPDALGEAAGKLGLLQGKTIVMEDESHTAALMDFVMYDCRESGKNSVDRFFAENHTDFGPQEIVVMRAMQNGYYSVFLIESAVPGAGVHVKDLVRNQKHFLADKGLSMSAPIGGALAGRVIPCDGFLTTTGAALPIDSEVLRSILMFLALPENKDFASAPPERRADITAQIIRFCISPRNTARTIFQNVNNPGPSAAFTIDDDQTSDAYRTQDEAFEPSNDLSARLPGRNDPCTCGSGKKYKKCCGG